MKENQQEAGLSYRDAGVDIDAGNRSVELMKAHVRATFRREVLSDIGGFGGLFALDTKKYREPVLVSGTDGVGTKLKLAFMMDKHDTIGQDAVDMVIGGADVLQRDAMLLEQRAELPRHGGAEAGAAVRPHGAHGREGAAHQQGQRAVAPPEGTELGLAPAVAEFRSHDTGPTASPRSCRRRGGFPTGPAPR